MLWNIALGLFCFMLGLIGSLFTPYHRTMRRRLKNIQEVAEDAYEGSVDGEAAVVFIMCEADLNVGTKGMKVFKKIEDKLCKLK